MEALLQLRYFLYVSIPIGLLALAMTYWRRPNTAQAFGGLAILIGVMPILGLGQRLYFSPGPGILLFAASPIVMGGVALAIANFSKDRPPLKGRFQISVPAVFYLTLVVGCIGGFVKLSQRIYYFQRDYCLAQFKQNPNIDNVVVLGFSGADQFFAQAVEFSLADRTDTRVRISVEVYSYGDYDEALASGSPDIRRIGNWIPGTTWTYKTSLNGKATASTPHDDIGINFVEHGMCYELAPLDLESVDDIVEHYDELEAMLAKWPRRDAPGSYTSEHGFTFEYWVVDVREPLPED